MTPVMVHHGCGEQVIRTPAGDHLEPETSAFGIHRPDGSKITGREIRAGTRGHRRHVCPPAEQLALMEGAGT